MNVTVKHKGELNPHSPGSSLLQRLFARIDSAATPGEAATRLDRASLYLRLGLGAVFIIGGCSKLSQLLDPALSQAMVDSYMGPAGYINSFFTAYLFDGPLGAVLTPWNFLTILSAFELFSGLALVAGVLVRPLALIYAFLLWSFVFSLPVVTSPGVEVAVKTYTSPAMFVQIRDIALSGFMFVLFNLGAGRLSVDRYLAQRVGKSPATAGADWEALALLTRLSLAAPLIIGGMFVGLNSIQSFATFAPLLVVMGVLLVAGQAVRPVAIGVALAMLWFMMQKLSADKSIIANLNGFKREFAFIGAAAVLFFYGGGSRFVWFKSGLPFKAAGADSSQSGLVSNP